MNQSQSIIEDLRAVGILEKIKKPDIGRLKKEFQSFTKNVTRIKTPKDLWKVDRAWNTWTKHFQNFVYQRVLGTNARKTDARDNWEKQQLEKDAWSLVIESSIFVNHSSGYTRLPIHFDPALMQVVWDSWVRKKKSIGRKLGRLGRIAFKALDDYLDSIGGETLDKEQKERFDFKGARVVIHSLEDDDSHVKFTRNVLKSLKRVYGFVSKTGLGKVFKGVTVNIDANHKSADAAGEYEPFSDSISMYIFGDNDRTTIHELGHRWWYKFIPLKRREQWDEFYYKNQTHLSAEEVDDIKQAFWKGFEAAPMGAKLFLQVFSHLKLETSKLKFKAVIKNDTNFVAILDHEKQGNIPDGDGPEAVKKMAQFAIDMFFEVQGTNGILVVPITTYGGKNSSEGYAESFALYHLRRRNMDAILRQIFRQVTFGRD